LLGVDPTRIPNRESWQRRMLQELSLPVPQRTNLLVIWIEDAQPVGFSAADRIVFGERANMHLHVFQREQRGRGLGTRCVRDSIRIYFSELKLKQLFCEPNAFNVAPNRTLQRTGFKYLKTHMTVPGPFNFHQAVTQWVIES
jgi:RimJ/RimL family protein N-acetyltransferase